MTAGTDPDWWRQAVVYQVYPRSFADSDGDGLGDLNGVTSRVPYLRALGVDAVWLSPFYPSELADGGYDVANYRDVDPRLGTLQDFDALAEALHSHGIRIFVDIVPNHSSNAHEWFQAALAAAPGSPERDRYLFRDGKGESGELPPSDWPSHFAPSAWTRTTNADGTPGQWYLHLFAPEQPDWNWDNDEVNADFLKTLRFWADRGVDGFRVDAAHLLKKDMSEPYRDSGPMDDIALYPTDGSHPLVDRDAVHDVYRTWRSVFNEYDPPRVAVAESGVAAQRSALYASADELGQSFNFELFKAEWDAGAFRDVIERGRRVAEASGSSSTWALSNHDVVRHATRFGLPPGTDIEKWLLTDGTTPPVDAEVGERRARAAILLLLALPGSVYLYQGEELGLPEVADLSPDVLQDPIWFRDGGTRKGRDGCRVPVPWTADGSSFGFGSGGAHLPQPAIFAEYAAASQDGVASSTLELYRAAMALRRKWQTAESLTWHDSDDEVVWFSRDNRWNSFTNFGTEPAQRPPGELLLASGPAEGLEVPGGTTVWFLA